MRLLARHRSGQPVAFGDGGSRTVDRLLADAQAVAGLLPPAAAGRDVLIVCADRYCFAAALLGAWQAGHGVALPPNAQDPVIRAMAGQPTTAALLHDVDESIGIDVRSLLTDPASPAPPVAPIELQPGRRLAVVHTSGSTGTARAHEKTAGQLLGEAEMLADQFGIGIGARVAATVPSHHIYGLLFALLVPLVGGGAFLRQSPLHAEAVAAALAAHDARVLVSVPAHLRALLALPTVPALQTVFSSGAALPGEVGDALRKRFGLVVTEVLGSTETGGIGFRRTDGDGAWTPLPGVRVAAGEGGRLSVDSPFLPPDTARPYAAEDRVEIAADGRFRHLGRADDIVKVAGKRVSLGDIEGRLRALPGVEDVAVAAIEVGGARGCEPVAVVVAAGHSPESLRTHLRRHLDAVVVPRKIRLVDEIPRDERGKVPRADLLAALERAARPRLELECGPDEHTRDGDRLCVRTPLRAPRDLYWFRGHFSHYPLVPGVVQLDLAIARSRAIWPDLGSLSRVLRLKFKRPIRPAERVMLELSRRHGAARVAFQYSFPEGPAGSGELDFAARA